MKDKELDGYQIYMLSIRGIQIPNPEIEEAKARIEALYQNYLYELERIESMPSWMLELELKLGLHRIK